MLNKLILVGVGALALGVMLALLYAGSSDSPLGGRVHNTQETFRSGLIIGDSTLGGCIQFEDTDKAGVSYATVLNGTMTVTTTQPASCL